MRYSENTRPLVTLMLHVKNVVRTGMVAIFILLPIASWAKLVPYEFVIDYKSVNFTGEQVKAMAIDGKIPGPIIEADVGDTLRVTFHNKMDVESSIHWHGILLPNDQDGVPYMTTPPIKAGNSLTYEFPITHHGTYWYHSHTKLQEQQGLYGALVLHPKAAEKKDIDMEYVVVLSDWTDEHPQRVLNNLKRDGDYYALKKDSVQSWLKVIEHGTQAIKNRIGSSWTRMGPMDISDIGYDAFLLNGQKESKLEGLRGGEVIRLRLVNASASSYQYVEFSGGSMTIVAADGVDTQHKKVDRLKIAIAETYDVLIKVPNDNMSYEFRATSEDGTGYSSLWLGDGHKMPARDILKPNPFLVDHSMHSVEVMEHAAMDHSKMGHLVKKDSKVNVMREYEGLRSPSKTNLKGGSDRVVVLNLTGNMERYVWSFDNKVLAEEDKILIRKGENVRFRLVNNTMMHHPLHLHGHFFRVLNGQGDYAPLKHTVNVPPMQTVDIEFYASEQKDWFFHCHNLYHMKNGMARVVRYQDAPGGGELNDKFYEMIRYDPWYGYLDTTVNSNFIGNEVRFSNSRNAFNLDFEHNYDDKYEVDINYEYNINRFLNLFIGGDFESDGGEDENLGVVGVRYVLPLLIKSELRLDSEGDLRLELSSELQLTDRAKFGWMWNTDDEYNVELDYEMNKHISLTANYDSDYYGGAGVKIKF